MERLNLTEEFADLLKFVSSTALAIRMSIVRKDPGRDGDILWLSNTLQKLELLTVGIKDRDIKGIRRTALELENSFQRYLYPFRYPDPTPQSKEVFENWSEWVDLHHAIDAFRRIALKVSPDVGLICVNCHHVYWLGEIENTTPPDCEWHKIEAGKTYYLCPLCNRWTVERQVQARAPDTNGN